MGRGGRQTRSHNQGCPRRIFLKKRHECPDQQGVILLVRFPPSDRDDLILFGDGWVGFENLRLDGKGDAVEDIRANPETCSQTFPERGGVGRLDGNGGQEL
jgi:hypothetical protein